MNEARKRPFLLGLTGSIGMGKSTTAAMFATRGVATWDADAAVARAYGPGGAALEPLKALFPDAITPDGVDRNVLRQVIAANPDALTRIEAIVHPIVAADRARFIETAGSDIVLFDIPLLFETGADTWLDATAVVTVDAETQRARVLARPGMTPEHFALILSKQMPDTEKRARADYIIETTDLDSAAKAVDDVLADIRGKLADA